MEKRCERCGAKPQGKFGLLDYCANCSRDLCPACMAKGCCGNVPALSGEEQDTAEQARIERCLCPDFELRGRTYEIWPDSLHSSNRCLVDPRTRFVVDTDHAFDPPLSNDELLAIYDYGKGY